MHRDARFGVPVGSLAGAVSVTANVLRGEWGTASVAPDTATLLAIVVVLLGGLELHHRCASPGLHQRREGMRTTLIAGLAFAAVRTAFTAWWLSHAHSDALGFMTAFVFMVALGGLFVWLRTAAQASGWLAPGQVGRG
jgi:hypothetical protein